MSTHPGAIHWFSRLKGIGLGSSAQGASSKQTDIGTGQPSAHDSDREPLARGMAESVRGTSIQYTRGS